jgi:hypothetical protein
MLRTLTLAAALLGLSACHSGSQADLSSKSGSAHPVKAVGHLSAQQQGGGGGVLGQVLGTFAKHQAHGAHLPEPTARFHPRR